MNHNIKIPESLYGNVLSLLNDVHFADSKGGMSDFNFYHDDLWLSDTAVIENLSLLKGEWCVELVFAHYQDPLRFIKRRITSFSCLKKATITANLMRRQAAKDQRGTLVVEIKQIRISDN